VCVPATNDPEAFTVVIFSAAVPGPAEVGLNFPTIPPFAISSPIIR
jgi:hypothetical protein